MAQALRDENGRFVDGSIANPTGANGEWRKHWQPADQRMAYWLTCMPVDELREFVNGRTLWHGVTFGKLTAYDQALIRRVIAMLQGDDKVAERVINRIDGKVPDVIHKNSTHDIKYSGGVTIEHRRVSETSEWLESLTAEPEVGGNAQPVQDGLVLPADVRADAAGREPSVDISAVPGSASGAEQPVGPLVAGTLQVDDHHLRPHDPRNSKEPGSDNRDIQPHPPDSQSVPAADQTGAGIERGAEGVVS